MKRSKGTYLQGVIEAERLVESLIENNLDIRETLKRMITRNEDPSYYYDGKSFCEGCGTITYINSLTTKITLCTLKLRNRD